MAESIRVCPRCRGVLVRNYDEDPTCMSCGYVDVPEEQLDKARDDARRASEPGNASPRLRGS